MEEAVQAMKICACAIENGVTKINIATDLFEAARKGAWEEGPSYMIYHRMRESYKQKLIHYMELLAGRKRIGQKVRRLDYWAGENGTGDLP